MECHGWRVSPGKHPFTHGAKIFIILVKTQHHLFTEQMTWINPQPSYISSNTFTNHNYTNTNRIPKSHCATVHRVRYNMPGKAVMKISNLKRLYEMKHRNFEETLPQNSEMSTTQINALKSSYQAASRILVTSMSQWNKIMHDWSDGHNVWRQTKRGNIQLCILIYVKMEITFCFSSYFVV